MRFVRLAAFVGSLVLLVGTLISIVNRRDDLSDEYDVRLRAASVLVTNSVETAIDRAVVLVEVAGPDTDPASLEVFAAPVDVCVADADDSAPTCTGDDLTGLDSYPEARQAAVEEGHAVAVVDEPSDSVLVVGDAEHVVTMRLPPEALVGASTGVVIDQYAGDVSVEVTPNADPTGNATDGVVSADGERLVTTTVTDPPMSSAVDVTVTVDPDIGITGDGGGRYLLLLALGTVLLAVAGWTFLAERRSLERRATTDEMTGLLNRREFERQSEEAMLNADRFRTGLCVMLVDLDRFKVINDTRGHHVGDEVLVEVARRLRSAVRDTDVVGRWGGDEFVILLPGLEHGTAVRNSAERIGAALSGTPVVSDISITGSIGAALYPRHGRTFNDLIRAADAAMYGAKSTGVTHRLADSLGADDTPTELPYEGPERRRSTPTGIGSG
jgi:diguanylate cyclase (GGDEF)-like protein